MILLICLNFLLYYIQDFFFKEKHNLKTKLVSFE